VIRRIRFEGDAVFKRLAGPAQVRALIERTEAARQSGVATPAVGQANDPGVARFERIAGDGGLAMVVARGAAALPEILQPLMAVHRADVPGLSQFDPLVRINPRLERGAPDWIRAEVARYRPAPPDRTGHTPLHGDFHVGQVIRDGDGRVWLLDLDDMAIGPPEADLGNFASHLATRPETRLGPARRGMARWLARTLDAYGSLGGIAELPLAAEYARIALLRRALKLAEAGAGGLLDELSPD